MPSPEIVCAQDEKKAVAAALADQVAVVQQSWTEPIYTLVYTANGAVIAVLSQSCKYFKMRTEKGVSILKFTGDQVTCMNDLARLAGTIST